MLTIVLLSVAGIAAVVVGLIGLFYVFTDALVSSKKTTGSHRAVVAMAVLSAVNYVVLGFVCIGFANAKYDAMNGPTVQPVQVWEEDTSPEG